jgi:hypothetical protein
MTIYYVSPSGNDSWIGTSAGANGTSGPFATLARALRAVEASAGADTVYIEGGTYTLTTPLTLKAADSNTTFAAYNGQQAVISGGVAVGGWSVNSSGVWTRTCRLGTCSS